MSIRAVWSCDPSKMQVWMCHHCSCKLENSNIIRCRTQNVIKVSNFYIDTERGVLQGTEKSTFRSLLKHESPGLETKGNCQNTSLTFMTPGAWTTDGQEMIICLSTGSCMTYHERADEAKPKSKKAHRPSRLLPRKSTRTKLILGSIPLVARRLFTHRSE